MHMLACKADVNHIHRSKRLNTGAEDRRAASCPSVIQALKTSGFNCRYKKAPPSSPHHDEPVYCIASCKVTVWP